jgi:vacuolar-type H+-ATPase subunit E/Vma4
MTAPQADQVMPALRPVCDELLRRAGADAQRVIDHAHDEASRIVEEARDTAGQVVQTARAAGQAAAAALIADEAAAFQRAMRRDVLAAQDDVYQQWRRGAAHAVLGLRDEPEYPRWRDTLARSAPAILGADARVVDDPAGGIIAQAGNRRIDLSLSAIAARALDRIAPEADGLWA